MNNEMLNLENLKTKLMESEIPGSGVNFEQLPYLLARLKVESEYSEKIESPDKSVVDQIVKTKRPKGEEYRIAVLNSQQLPLTLGIENGEIARASVVFEQQLRASVTKENVRNYYVNRLTASILNSYEYCLW